MLAAANPVYGQYDRSRRPQENIGLPDSLLSRFDLLFIVLDQLDPAIDRHLSEHVIKSHQYRRPGTIMEPEALNQASTLNLDDPAESNQDTPVWQRGGRGTETSRGDGRAGDVLTKEFLKKYIHYAKHRVAPVLSDAAMENISQAYARMRSQQSQRNLPVTARSLETIIRLSSASAKARLSPSVDEEDVEVAVELINFVLFHEIGDPVEGTAVAAAVAAGRRVGGLGSGSASASAAEEEEKGEGEGEGADSSSSSRGRKRLRRSRDAWGSGTGEDEEEDEDLDFEEPSGESKRPDRRAAAVAPSQAALFLEQISAYGQEDFALSALLQHMQGSLVIAVRELAGLEFHVLCEMLAAIEAEGKIMFTEGQDAESSSIILL